MAVLVVHFPVATVFYGGLPPFTTAAKFPLCSSPATQPKIAASIAEHHVRFYVLSTLVGFTLLACAPPAHIRAIETSSLSREAWPEILPLQDLLADHRSAQPGRLNAQEQGAQLSKRVAGLKSRAQRLQRPVIDQTRRARLLAAISRQNG